MKAMKLTAVVVGIGLMLCGCGNDASSGTKRQDVLQYVSQDGNYRVVGPVWDCSKQINGKCHYPIVIAEKGKDGCIYWCHEVSHGSSGNFDIVSNDGAFYFSDNSFCYSDEMKDITHMDFISSTTTNRVVLNRTEP